jgi:hypothetical protein
MKVDRRLSLMHYKNIFLLFLIFSPIFSFAQTDPGLDLVPFQSGALWGYKDRTSGKIIVQPQYSFADYLFTKGVTKVIKWKKAGLMNRSGTEVIPCIYDDILWDPELKSYINNEGLIKIQTGKKFGLINEKGITVVTAKYDEINSFAGKVAQVRTGLKKGYINSYGSEIIPCIYDNITNKNNLLYAVQKNKIRIFDYYGKSRTSVAYDSIALDFIGGLALVKKDTLYGFIDTTGKEIISCLYRKVIFDKKSKSYFPDDNAIVIKNSKYGIIDKKGNVVVPCQYDWEVHLPVFTNFHDVTKGGLLGIIDKTGKEIIPCKYEEINWSFKTQKDVDNDPLLKNKTLFIASLDGSWGMLNENNKQVIPFKYEALESFSNGLAVAGLNGKYGFINTRDSIVIPIIYDFCQSFDDDFAVAGYYEFKDKAMINKFGLIDKTGKVILPCEYSIRYIKDHKCYVVTTRDKKVGVVDSSGKIIITPEYTISVSWDSYAKDKMIKALLYRKYGFYSNENKLVIPFVYDDALSFSEGFVAVNRNLKWGFIDKAGKVIVPVKYDDVHNFRDSMALVKFGLKYGYINNKGVEVIPIQYFQASDFYDGYARIQNDETSYGLIDKTGATIIPPTQEKIFLNSNTETFFTEGMALVQQEELYGFYNTKGELTIPCKYAQADFFSQNRAVVKDNFGNYFFIDKKGHPAFPSKYTDAYSFYKGLAVVKNNGLFYMVDTLGKIVRSFTYDDIKPFSEGYAAVRSENLWGFIDEKGSEVIPPKYEKAAAFLNGKASIELKGYSFSINTKGEIIGEAIKK